MTIINTRLRLVAHVAIVALMASLVAVAVATPAHAASINVDEPDDENSNNGDCSLREAIENANSDTNGNPDCEAGTGADVINLEDENYELTDGELLVTDADGLEITGDGVQDTEIDGGGNPGGTCDGTPVVGDDRVFNVAAGAVLDLEELAVQNGVLEDNASVEGGGIFNAGDLSLTRVLVTDNLVCAGGTGLTAFGGGIANTGAAILTIDESTIEGNTAAVDDDATNVASGGGIAHTATGSAFIENSTIANNSAEGAAAGTSEGGGIWTDESMTLENSTISGNTAEAGGGIFFFTTTGETVGLEHVTITDNDDAGLTTSGAGDGVVEPEFTLIADQDGGDDCDLAEPDDVNSLGYNLSSDSSCEFDDADDQEDADADLDGLDDNGGETETHLPDESSDAVNAIDDTDCSSLNEDQRGEERPDDDDDECDIGAVEHQQGSEDGGGSSGGGSGGSSNPDDELDVTPETATNIVPGDLTHTVTAVFDESELDDDDDDSVDFKIISGPNANGDDEEDFECSLSSDECSITYTGNGQVGTDVICVWLDTDDDEDYNAAGSTSDGGACDTETQAGGTDSDSTDVVSNTWSTAPTPTPTPTPTTTPSTDGPTTIRVATTITINFNKRTDVFSGKVKSGRRRCRTGRVVSLRFSGTTQGSDVTSSTGAYRIPAKGANGKHRTKVARKVYTAGNGDTIICRGARSRTLNV